MLLSQKDKMDSESHLICFALTQILKANSIYSMVSLSKHHKWQATENLTWVIANPKQSKLRKLLT